MRASSWQWGGAVALAALLGLLAAISVAREQGPQALPTVSAAQLPAEARETLRLIDLGGPFPYFKDGTVFGNRERLLPTQPYGYYREYTVPTPGARDRGARRIIGGRDGDRYYTEDHYRSFRRVVR